MKSVGIITHNGNHNYGNKLQVFAVQETFKKLGYHTEILWKRYHIYEDLKNYLYRIVYPNKPQSKRIKKFLQYNKNYLNIKYINSFKDTCDYYSIGSDQVWNCHFREYKPEMFANFSNKEKNFSFSASFGISEIPKDKKEEYRNGLNNLRCISVREERGKELVEELTGRKDTVVLVDPTMLLTTEEWDNISKKPKNIPKKYILNYFLGELSEDREKEIERVAKEKKCEIINILDKNDPFYCSGPSEFLYLEKHAELICTDSFHSCVFAILYNRPFIVFDRIEPGVREMNSRIDTLLNKFKLEGRKYNGKRITNENLNHNYSEVHKILKDERKKSEIFLQKCLKMV